MTSRNCFGLSRHIPDPVKYEVRKRCGFGCIVCGDPFIEYHHFTVPFRSAEAHIPDGITLLCPSHHKEADRGLISHEQVLEENSNPYGVRTGHVNYLLRFGTKPPIVSAGSCIIRCKEKCRILINSSEYLDLRPVENESPIWELSAVFFDKNRQAAGFIRRNEVVIPSSNYDFQTVLNRFYIRDSESVIAQFSFSAPDRFSIEQMRIFDSNTAINIDERCITIRSGFVEIKHEKEEFSDFDFMSFGDGSVIMDNARLPSDLI